jgi:small subunit ribosomal protein S18
MGRSSTRKSAAAKRAPKKKKASPFGDAKLEWVDYKDVNLLRKFVSDRGKIRARRVTGLTAQQQRAIAQAIKLARELGLVPYLNRPVTVRSSKGRRTDRRGGRRDDQRDQDEGDEGIDDVDESADIDDVEVDVEVETEGGDE